MHIEVYAHGVIGIRIVALGREDKESSKFRIAVERTDALYDVPVEDFKYLARDLDLTADEAWAARRETVIHNSIEFPRVGEG